MKLDPTKMKDWQVAEAAEANLKPAADLLRDLGIRDDEWDAYGKYLAKTNNTMIIPSNLADVAGVLKACTSVVKKIEG